MSPEEIRLKTFAHFPTLETLIIIPRSRIRVDQFTRVAQSTTTVCLI